jgi:hypothetical protein
MEEDLIHGLRRLRRFRFGVRPRRSTMEPVLAVDVLFATWQ